MSSSQPTAILSVYDKTGLVELARGLAAKGVRPVSYTHLRAHET